MTQKAYMYKMDIRSDFAIEIIFSIFELLIRIPLTCYRYNKQVCFLSFLVFSENSYNRYLTDYYWLGIVLTGNASTTLKFTGPHWQLLSSILIHLPVFSN